MDYIYGKFLGNSSISYNGTELSFSYNKVKALFIYLIMQKNVTRDEVSNLLWCDKPENIARKNLRNGIYIIKKCTNADIFITNKSNISLNDKFVIETDVDSFIKNPNLLDLYKGEFLKGFNLKDAENYDKWLTATGAHIDKIYFDGVTFNIEREKLNKNYSKIEYYSNLLIAQDEFNEAAYRNLIESYYYQGKINDAVKTYNSLSSILDKELSISPDEETEKVFSKVLKLISERKSTHFPKQFFFGRYEEIKLLEITYNNFISRSNTSKSIIIKGEMGIGKTQLKDKFKAMLTPAYVLLIEVDCFEFDTENTLKPFKTIINKAYEYAKDNKLQIPTPMLHMIDNFIQGLSNGYSSSTLIKFDAIVDLTVNLLKLINTHKKVVLIFEDIQWMDSLSLSILTNLMFDTAENENLFLLTCRDEHNSDVDKFMTIMNKYHKINTIFLKRFLKKDVTTFLRKALPNINLSKAVLDKIYLETEGNTFFIVEYINLLKLNKNINLMTSKMKDIIRSRFIGISASSKKLLEIASLFDDEAPISIFTKFLKLDELEVINIIEELENKAILKEFTKGDGIFFKFTHQKFREFIYMNLSSGKKKVMHNMVGKFLEKDLLNTTKNVNSYHKLIYHFENADNYIDTLKYIIKNLYIYLNFSHELFPILEYDEKFNNTLYFNEKNTEAYLVKLEYLLDKIKSEISYNDEIEKLELGVLHIKGRFLIRKGDYKSGIALINTMTNKALLINDSFYILEGYKQMIYYCIQTNDTSSMKNYLEPGLKLAKHLKDQKEIGIFLRLYAQYHKLSCNYFEAEKLLLKSIKTLKIDGDKYAVAIAAAYNYIGDIRNTTCNYTAALKYYIKAIDICSDKNVLTSLAIFYVNAGHAAFNIGNFKLSEEYLKKALAIYGNYDLIWGRTIAESLMCILSIRKNKLKTAEKFLYNAKLSSKLLKSPKELSLLQFAIDEFKSIK